MIFPREKKKELWRYASRNNPPATTCDANGLTMPMQQPQLPHHPHQRHPPATTQLEESLRQLNTPPPPYSSMNCSIDCSGSYRHSRSQFQADANADADMCSANEEESDYSYIKDGCSYASSAVDILSDENELCPPPASPPRFSPTMHAATFALTAANMFRNCCGGGGDSSSSSSNGSTMRTTPTASRRHILSRQQRISTTTPPTATATAPTISCPILHPHPQPQPVQALRQRTLNQNFNALLKALKNKQIAELLQAVKSRVDPPPAALHHTKCNSNNNVFFSNTITTTTPSYLQCILIKCNTPGDETQHLTTCQLFLWSDLRVATELRRLPICPSARDYVYICCNPLHWYRILQPIDSEAAPPPYHRTKMLRLRDADSEGNTQNIERSTSAAWAVQSNSSSSSSQHSKSISSIIKQAELSQLYVPSLESFTTDGKERSACSKVWCQIAYWELAQRVGEFFHAKKSAVNIYADGPVDCAGESMCLRDLGGKRHTSDAVQNTRQKVGLGVTLSLECGDVWIYNRSNVPIFVDSPTLAERLDRVCKVLPGYCLKAFETHRAQWLACKQTQHNQLGPIDRFSMKISFAKGWGNTYRRQDVMGCPCWLEVHFNHLR